MNFELILKYLVALLLHPLYKSQIKQTNIILMLADDLGYGDTSVYPFTGSYTQTPELQRMASKGVILTNFHTAAATCTPSRASILTGMYPWRLGIKGVYEYGEKAPKGNRNDFLPLVVNLPMLFRAGNYTTLHSGKWHLGGMRNDDYNMRTCNNTTRKCLHPGPHQQGFNEYVSVLDGPGAPRQNEYQIDSYLHSRGCELLLHDDVSIGSSGGPTGEYLSDCEARHAIRMMSNSVKQNRPFYLNLWFHAPHGPWEYLHGPWDAIYNIRNMQSRMVKYQSMISAMDRSVGTVLDAVRALGIERNTLIVFTSDNGPEDAAGTTSGYRGNKRYIYEGGIRVPCIMQWVGTIPKGSNSSIFSVTTDLLPTFINAAGLTVPKHLHADGVSLLPELLSNNLQSGGARSGTSHNSKQRTQSSSSKHRFNAAHITPHTTAVQKQIIEHLSTLPSSFSLHPNERVTLWHNDWEGPRMTAGWINDFKFLLDGTEQPYEMFDMINDPLEKINLLTNSIIKQILERLSPVGATSKIDSQSGKPVLQSMSSIAELNSSRSLLSGTANVSSQIQYYDRSNTKLHVLIATHTSQLLKNFARHGNEPHVIYLTEQSWRFYTPTPESDIRYRAHNVYKHITRDKAKIMKDELINMADPCPVNACTCTLPTANEVPEYPFSRCKHMLSTLVPGLVPSASHILSE